MKSATHSNWRVRCTTTPETSPTSSISCRTSARVELTQVLNKLAFYDNLTGLPNRNLFVDRLSRTMAAAQRNRGGRVLPAM